jgi:hypothetical protein
MVGVFWLRACGQVPITSLHALSKIDVATTDPAQVRAAVKVPKVIKPRAGRMRLRVTVKVGDAPEIREDFALSEVTDRAELRALDYAIDPGTALYAYRIADADVPRFEAFRAGLIKSTRGRHSNLGIAILPDACRSGALPRGPLTFSTYLRTSETGTYVPLTMDVDLRSIDPTRDISAIIPPCK